MHRSLGQHSPLITPRIEFKLQAAGGLPVITPRINFSEEWPAFTDNTVRESDKNLGDESGTMEDEDESSDSDDDEHDEIPLARCNNRKIPKPQGEPGRPNSGGYNIESELRGWSPDLLGNVTVSFLES